MPLADVGRYMPGHAGGRSALRRRNYHCANRTFPGAIKILEIDYQELAKTVGHHEKRIERSLPFYYSLQWNHDLRNWKINFKFANKRHLNVILNKLTSKNLNLVQISILLHSYHNVRRWMDWRGDY